jgi:hypothetical protein
MSNVVILIFKSVGESLQSHICTTPFMVFSVTYPILRLLLGYTKDQQLHH